MGRLQDYEKKRGLDSDAVDIVGAEQGVNLAAGASKGIALGDARGIEVDITSTIRAEELDLEQFMRQVVEVHLHEPATEDEHQHVEVTVNGDHFVSIRGETKTMRRYHLAVLAQAKTMRLQQKKITNPDGSMGYEERAVLRLMYPFSVMHDPAGARGAAWLKQVLGNPA